MFKKENQDPVETAFILLTKAFAGLVVTATIGLALLILGVINV